MIKWAIWKKKEPLYRADSEHSISINTDVIAWREYNKGFFDWVPQEWPGYLYELEKCDKDD